MDEFEGYAAGQASRIASTADAVAQKLGMAQRDRELLQQACLLHDIGEVRMGRDYIRAPRPLTTAERLDLERHSVIGEQEAAKLDLPKSVQLLVRWHHEWWNGSGYPDKMEAEQIPLSARILRIADAYCAMTAGRPWREPVEDADARRELLLGAGIEFDPAIVFEFRNIDLPDPVNKVVADQDEIFSTFAS